MRGSFIPAQVRARRAALERAGTAMIRAADRRRLKPASRPAPAPSPAISPAEPRRLTLSDLPRLRKEGRLP